MTLPQTAEELVSALRNKLVMIIRDLEDEGDRVYFGSTNDADELREIFHALDAHEWDKLIAANRETEDEISSLMRGGDEA